MSAKPGRFTREARESIVERVKLRPFAHGKPSDGMCAMEAVAFLAGEPHSDVPECASPVIAAVVRVWNDVLPDRERQALKPYVARIVGSRSDDRHEATRKALVEAWAHGELATGPRGKAFRLVDYARRCAANAEGEIVALPWERPGRVPPALLASMLGLLDEMLDVAEPPSALPSQPPATSAPVPPAVAGPRQRVRRPRAVVRRSPARPRTDKAGQR